MPRLDGVIKILRRNAVEIALILFVILVPAYFVTNFFWDACVTESRGKFTAMSGYDFEISETDCDLIAKDDAISVLVSKTGQTKQTAVFKYNPAKDLRPTMRMLGPHTVRISIPRISAVYFQRDRWEDLSIEYDIGQVDFPSTGGNMKE